MADEKSSVGWLTKVIATVFGAVVAPILVAVGVKYLSPKDTPPPSPAVTDAGKSDTQTGGRKVLFAFNGKDLSGFYTYSEVNGRDKDPKHVFTVQDGMLRISGEENRCYLATLKDTYKDYKLVVEYKWGEKTWPPFEEKARYGAILVNAADVGDGRLYGYRCAVGEGKTGDLSIQQGGPKPLWLDYYLNPKPEGKDTRYDKFKNPQPRIYMAKGQKCDWFGGQPTFQKNHDRDWKDVKGFRSKLDGEKPTGEWNTLEIICAPKSIEIDLNDERVNFATQSVAPAGGEPRAWASQGKIAIYPRGAEIFIRKLEVISLKAG